MKSFIENFIKERVQSVEFPIFREPLIGYAKADDKLFPQLKNIVGEKHLLPTDLLPEAKTVMAFYLPFTKEIIDENRQGTAATLLWAQVYKYTNEFIDETLQALKESLEKKGVNLAFLPPTYEFDIEKLIAQWSHKHVAFACGLGQFGLNQLLITRKGCAGRFGSAVLDIDIKPTGHPAVTHSCLQTQGCDYCITICPVKALSPDGFDRQRCYKMCLANDKRYPELESVEVCGKCSTGPCAYLH